MQRFEVCHVILLLREKKKSIIVEYRFSSLAFVYAGRQFEIISAIDY